MYQFCLYSRALTYLSYANSLHPNQTPRLAAFDLLFTMAQMAHFSFQYYFTIPNSEFRIPKFALRISKFGIVK